MFKIVNLDKEDEKVKEFLLRLKLDDDQYILEIEGKPLAGVVAPAQLEQTVRAKEQLFETIDNIWKRNREVSEEQVEQDVAEAVQSIRQQKI